MRDRPDARLIVRAGEAERELARGTTSSALGGDRDPVARSARHASHASNASRCAKSVAASSARGANRSRHAGTTSPKTTAVGPHRSHGRARARDQRQRQIRGGVDADAIGAALCPRLEPRHDRLLNLRVVEREQRLLPLALLIVVVAGIRAVDEWPAARAKPSPVPRRRAVRAHVTERREVAMDVRRSDIDEDAHAARVRGLEQAIERGLAAELRIDRASDRSRRSGAPTATRTAA